MPNTLTDLMPKILARALISLRKTTLMPVLVNTDYGTDAQGKGSTINVPVPVAQTTSAVSPSNTPPAPANITPKTVPIALDQWQKTNFHLSDKDYGEINANAAFIPSQMAESVSALANDVNAHILAQYKGIYGIVGTAGTTPFASDVTAATAAVTKLNQQLCPRTMRRAVLDFAAEGNALGLAAFRDASQSGKDSVIREGQLGRFFGIDWNGDTQVPTHTSTALTAGAATINGAQAAGAGSTDNNATGTISIAKATNAAPLVAGDIIEFTVGGVVQQHTVVTGVTLAVGNTTVTVAPALRVATAGSEAVTLRATHVVNMAFHRNAFAFASRPLMDDVEDLVKAGLMTVMSDPQTGLVMRLERSRQYKQTVWEIDILWGSKLVRPELAVRIAG